MKRAGGEGEGIRETRRLGRDRYKYKTRHERRKFGERGSDINSANPKWGWAWILLHRNLPWCRVCH
jgi:hypothetical protein